LFVLRFFGLGKEIEQPKLNKVECIDGYISLVEDISSIDPDKKTAIFIHGLCSEVGENFSGLYNELKKEFNIFAFSYPTLKKGIRENSKELSRMINKFTNEVYIFAHSMGGLVARSSVVYDNSNIKSIIMAGTPNNGSRLASSGSVLKRIVSYICNFKNRIE